MAWPSDPKGVKTTKCTRTSKPGTMLSSTTFPSVPILMANASAATGGPLSPVNSRPSWGGDFLFLAQNLVKKDFTVRYRNMSLGVAWSLLNPLVMMVVLWFVFTKIFPNNIPNYAVFVLCGIVPYNVFTLTWVNGTVSVVDNATLIKRVPVPREIIPISTVLGNCVNMSAQILLLLVMVAATNGVNRYWGWLLVVWPMELVFVMGLSLLFSALNVYVRDIRYLVESINVVLFWLVPIFYDFGKVPSQYRDLYQYNPVAAVVMASRNVLLDGVAPSNILMAKLTASSLLVLALGTLVFRKLRTGFYNYL